MRYRLVRISCWLGLLCGALLIGLYALAIPTTANSTSEPLLAAFDEVLQRVVSLRQLQPKETIQRAVRSRQQIRTAVTALAQDALSPTEWEAERKAMVQWGLIAPDFRLKEFVLDLLTEQAAGYYDPKQRTFFIADWLPQVVQKPVMAHELVHALQDQHYDLQGNFDLVKDQADLTLARKALIEGDAVVVMFAYLLEPLGLSMDDLPDMRTLLQASMSLVGEPVPGLCTGAAHSPSTAPVSLCAGARLRESCPGARRLGGPGTGLSASSRRRQNRSCIRKNILLTPPELPSDSDYSISPQRSWARPGKSSNVMC